jgi:hypothetical protein
MIIWSPDTASAIWLNRHRFGEMGGRGLALFGALWGKDGKDVLAGGWNGGWSRWTRTIGPNEADVGPVEGAWEPATGVSGHTREVASIGWDPKQDYLISVRWVYFLYTGSETDLQAPIKQVEFTLLALSDPLLRFGRRSLALKSTATI